MNTHTSRQLNSIDEIEAIVQVVLKRLGMAAVRDPSAEGTAPSDSVTSPEQPAEHSSATSPPTTNSQPTSLALCDHVVALEQLDGKLDGLKIIQVLPSAVVTPAVRDELRARNIRLERTETSPSESPSPKLLIVASLEKQAAVQGSAQFIGASQDCAVDARRIAAHFSTGGSRVVWSTRTPFAAIHTSTTIPSLRAVQLARLQDIARAVSEARPNVMIIDDLVWSSADVTELAEIWTRSAR